MNPLSYFDYPWVFLFLLPLIWLVVHIVRKEYIVRYTDLLSRRQRTLGRFLLISSRVLLFAIALSILAGPGIIKTKTVEMPPKIVLLSDNSLSMYPYNQPTINITEVKFNDSDVSSLMNQFSSYGNIILYSDLNLKGLSNSLDKLFLKNVSVNYFKLNKTRNEASVWITSQNNAIEQNYIPINIYVEKTYNSSVKAALFIDGGKIGEYTMGENKKIDSYTVNRRLSVGYHNITAIINPDKDNFREDEGHSKKNEDYSKEDKDHFKENNVYYKTIHVIKKPKVTVLREKGEKSYFDRVLEGLYNVTYINRYSQNYKDVPDILILEDYPADMFSDDELGKLYEDVFNGMGLFVLGGENSYEYGNYNEKLNELLPVTVGTGKKKIIQEVNVVVLIDISGSTTQQTEGTKALNIEKAIAIDLISQTKKGTKVGVVAFNNKAKVVYPLSEIDDIGELDNEIASLRNKGNTRMDKGLEKAYELLRNARGSKNVIIISDGFTMLKPAVKHLVKDALKEGIQTHVVDIGERTNKIFLRDIAILGNGKYFRSENKRSVKLIFHTDENEDLSQKISLMTLLPEHFIARKSMKINATITGFNQVLPKEKSLTLVSTTYNNPILVVGRNGLGKVVVMATGSKWTKSLFSNPILPRSINWILGSKAVQGTTVVSNGKKIEIISDDKQEGYEKIGDKYVKEISIESYNPGIYTEGGAQFAVNYDEELKHFILNKDNAEIIESYGGREISSINELGKLESSYETVKTKKDLSFYLIAVLLSLYMLEITIRRIFKYRKSR